LEASPQLKINQVQVDKAKAWANKKWDYMDISPIENEPITVTEMGKLKNILKINKEQVTIAEFISIIKNNDKLSTMEKCQATVFLFQAIGFIPRAGSADDKVEKASEMLKKNKNEKLFASCIELSNLYIAIMRRAGLRASFLETGDPSQRLHMQVLVGQGNMPEVLVDPYDDLIDGSLIKIVKKSEKAKLEAGEGLLMKKGSNLSVRYKDVDASSVHVPATVISDPNLERAIFEIDSTLAALRHTINTSRDLKKIKAEIKSGLAAIKKSRVNLPENNLWAENPKVLDENIKALNNLAKVKSIEEIAAIGGFSPIIHGETWGSPQRIVENNGKAWFNSRVGSWFDSTSNTYISSVSTGLSSSAQNSSSEAPLTIIKMQVGAVPDGTEYKVYLGTDATGSYLGIAKKQSDGYIYMPWAPGMSGDNIYAENKDTPAENYYGPVTDQRITRAGVTVAATYNVYNDNTKTILIGSAVADGSGNFTYVITGDKKEQDGMYYIENAVAPADNFNFLVGVSVSVPTPTLVVANNMGISDTFKINADVSGLSSYNIYMGVGTVSYAIKDANNNTMESPSVFKIATDDTGVPITFTTGVNSKTDNSITSSTGSVNVILINRDGQITYSTSQVFRNIDFVSEGGFFDYNPGAMRISVTFDEAPANNSVTCTQANSVEHNDGDANAVIYVDPNRIGSLAGSITDANVTPQVTVTATHPLDPAVTITKRFFPGCVVVGGAGYDEPSGNFYLGENKGVSLVKGQFGEIKEANQGVYTAQDPNFPNGATVSRTKANPSDFPENYPDPEYFIFNGQSIIFSFDYSFWQRANNRFLMEYQIKKKGDEKWGDAKYAGPDGSADYVAAAEAYRFAPGSIKWKIDGLVNTKTKFDANSSFTDYEVRYRIIPGENLKIRHAAPWKQVYVRSAAEEVSKKDAILSRPSLQKVYFYFPEKLKGIKFNVHGSSVYLKGHRKLKTADFEMADIHEKYYISSLDHSPNPATLSDKEGESKVYRYPIPYGDILDALRKQGSLPNPGQWVRISITMIGENDRVSNTPFYFTIGVNTEGKVTIYGRQSSINK
ncbi:MAG: hypothetical protein KKA19_03570, partial [Candidatus Margulisbacteria bacterium]|nr:hypothetical protein [Candidatus Margulisiibacteriota bacterium]